LKYKGRQQFNVKMLCLWGRRRRLRVIGIFVLLGILGPTAFQWQK
jgi:hypothetical protein